MHVEPFAKHWVIGLAVGEVVGCDVGDDVGLNVGGGGSDGEEVGNPPR